MARLVDVRAPSGGTHCGTEYPRQEQLVGVNGYWTSQPEPFLYCVFRSWEGRRPLTASGVWGTLGTAPGSSRMGSRAVGGVRREGGGGALMLTGKSLQRMKHIYTAGSWISIRANSAANNMCWKMWVATCKLWRKGLKMIASRKVLNNMAQPVL